jgi:hypothetical protein
LKEGTTAHAAFTLPLNLTYSEQQHWSVDRMTARPKILQRCMFIIWGKYTMSLEVALEAWDLTLQHLGEILQLWEELLFY